MKFKTGTEIRIELEEKVKVECSQNVSPIPWGCWLIKIQKKKNRAFADLKYT